MFRSYSAALACLVAGCTAEVGTTPTTVTPTQFKVRIENVAPYKQLKSGVFNVPVGKAGPGAIGPGDAFEVAFTAAKGQRLSFASMFGASNDWFIAPEAKGLALFDNGVAVTGDVTDRVFLWDVGTEVDEEPAVGPHTGPKQATSTDGPGANDPNATVRRLVNPIPLSNGGSFMAPTVAQMVKVTLTNRGSEFRLRIENVASDTTTLLTSEGPKPVRFSPGVFAVTTAGEPLFTDGQKDRGLGLELIAEMGNPADLGAAMKPLTGVATGNSPGVLVVHRERAPLFALGEQDRGLGLERIAEDGQAQGLGDMLKKLQGESLSKVAVFDTPVGKENPSALPPGSAYELTVSAVPGERLSFVTMFGWSNDWFFGTPESGVQLFDGDQPLYGPITGELKLYDLGSELSEEPGVGSHTGPQQAEPNSGPLDPDRRVREVSADQYAHFVSDHLQVTLEPVDGARR